MGLLKQRNTIKRKTPQGTLTQQTNLVVILKIWGRCNQVQIYLTIILTQRGNLMLSDDKKGNTIVCHYFFISSAAVRCWYRLRRNVRVFQHFFRTHAFCVSNMLTLHEQHYVTCVHLPFCKITTTSYKTESNKQY